MGSSSTPATSNTQTMTAPPSWIQPFQQFGAQEAARLYGAGGQSPLTGQASNYLSGLLNGTGIQKTLANATQGATPTPQSLQDTSEGKFLNSNPYLDQMVGSATRPVIDAVQSQFSRAGRYGSAANQDVLARNVGEITSGIYGNNYARERQNQLAAGNAITGYLQNDINRQVDAAKSIQNMQLQGMLFAPQLGQEQSGQGNLARYLQAINGMNVGQQGSASQTTPYFSNPLGQAVGVGAAGLQGASYLNQLFPGALRGGTDYLGSLFSGGGGIGGALGSGLSGAELGGLTDYASNLLDFGGGFVL